MATVKEAFASMARNIEEKTGKDVGTWVKAARNAGLARHGDIVTWLKTKHAVSHGYANFLALQTIGSGYAAETSEDLVAAQYAGPKMAIRPIYDRLVEVVRTFGSDVEIAPKKNNVSIRRRKQFALLQPSTATRFDVGLILPEVNPTPRLELSGNFNPMFTHRVRLASVKDVDAELRRWLKRAYDAS